MRRAVITTAVAAAVIGPAAGSLSCAALLWADVPGEIYPPMQPLVGSLSAKRCGQCHPDQYQEWADSHHGQAITDALYRADFVDQHEPFFCDQCHAPLVEQMPKRTTALLAVWPRLWPVQKDNPRYDAALHEEGVTCVTCHQVNGAIEGPRGDPAPHPARRSEALVSEQVCERCHTLAMQHIGSLQRPLMETVTEWREYRAKGGDKVCQDCHMPRVADRPAALGAEPKPARSHRWLGPFDAALLDQALEVKVEGEPPAAVRLRNLTGHRLPTAEPHRFVVVRVEAEGRVVESRIERVVDTYRVSEKPGQDTTLAPREERTIPLPAHTSRVSVRFLKWTPGDETAKAAGLSDPMLVHELFSRDFPLPSGGPK
ncbi:MAG TPA: hypothetical protein VFA20_29150 [Myxococcaceae bacterium]|nr:hypothetical protein [Myxococcaceae bacterium]